MLSARRMGAATTTVVAALTLAAAPLWAQLRVRSTGDGGAWTTWWQPSQAPTAWTSAHDAVARAVTWRETSPGVELGELALSGSGEAWRLKVVLVRLDPARVRLALDADIADDGRIRPWTITATAEARQALVALNAGQFTDAGPWGWLVHESREVQRPGRGALAGAVVVGTDGRIRVVDADSVPALSADPVAARIAEAVQSYPMLLQAGGVVPAELRDGRAAARIDLDHRDARLAIGELRDGRILIALTRFDALGSLLGVVPFGLTVQETSALMGALGCSRALMLDGGISAQLAVADVRGKRAEWSGMRKVPLGLVATPRTAP